MAKIKPFKGILYNTETADLRKTTAPPYDVISPAMHAYFYRSDRRNIVRLILGKDTPRDTTRNNKYTRAARFLNEWLRDKTLIRDRKNSIYVYEQEYLHGGKKIKRIGFIALMKIEDPRKSGVLPHEYTLAKPKADRLNLIKATRANLSPIFSLFEDKNNAVSKILRRYTKRNRPLFSFETEGTNHALWRLTDRHLIKKTVKEMRGKKIFIADGHHRYEVALSYRDAMRRKKGFRPAMNYVMMYFSSLSGGRRSLTILSTHRVLRHIRHFSPAWAEKRLKEHFIVEKLRDKSKLFAKLEGKKSARNSFGMYARGGTFYFLSPKKPFRTTSLADSAKIKDLKRLDVSILHEVVIGKLLGVKTNENSIKYVRNEDDALEAVESGGYQLAFFLRPTDINDMRKIALKGVMMPQKSTYFYPKLLTGLVINKF